MLGKEHVFRNAVGALGIFVLDAGLAAAVCLARTPGHVARGGETGERKVQSG